MKIKFFVAIFFVAFGASPLANAAPWSDDYKRGWCAGYGMAVEILNRNRDHWRSLIGAPKMSHDEVIKWIYNRPWIDGPTLRTAPRRLDQPEGVPENGPPAVESVDLYMMLSLPLGALQVQDGTEWQYLNCGVRSN